MSRFSLIPAATPSLDQAGIEAVLGRLAAGDPEQARAMARDLRRDPRGTIQRTFQLTTSQRWALRNMPDSDLDQWVEPVARSLRQGTVGQATVHFQASSIQRQPGREEDLKCSFGFKAFGVEVSGTLETDKANGTVKPSERTKKEPVDGPTG